MEKSHGGKGAVTYDAKKDNKNNWVNKTFKTTHTGYPNTILKFKRDEDKVHPTQKPVGLMEYMIKTYTNKNMVVMDNTMGSGSTGVAAVLTERNFIGIEKDSKYYKIAGDRISEAKKNKNNKQYRDILGI